MENMKKEPKYNVGDKVIYLDLQKNCDIGIIKKVEEMVEYEWNKNKEDKHLYKLNNYDYLRYEREIVGLYKE